jgi:hypothetical protein
MENAKTWKSQWKNGAHHFIVCCLLMKFEPCWIAEPYFSPRFVCSTRVMLSTNHGTRSASALMRRAPCWQQCVYIVARETRSPNQWRQARISISLRWVYLVQLSISILYIQSGGSNLINNAAREEGRGRESTELLFSLLRFIRFQFNYWNLLAS